MRHSSWESFRWYAMLCGLAAVLGLLAILQYRSVQEVGLATTEQMHASLRGSLMDVRQALDRELGSLCNEFDFVPNSGNQNALHNAAAGFERWRSIASDPSLVQDVYVLQRDRGSSLRLLKLDPNRTDFEAASWPEQLATLRDQLDDFFPERGPAPPPNDNSAHSHRSFAPPAFFPGRPEQMEPPHGGPEFAGQNPDRHMPFSPWLIDQNIPALIHPITPPPFHGEGRQGPEQWLAIVLDRNVLSQRILPKLVQRYFGSKEASAYEIAIIDKNDHTPDLYPANSVLKNHDGRFPDAVLNLFGPPDPEIPNARGALIPAPPNPGTAATREKHGQESGNENRDQQAIIEPLSYNADRDADWEIIARHRAGSVEAAVASLSHRNLVFNFAVLLVLAATVGLIITGSLRARRFGQLQMDFVANVSHELRTPLTGIVSASQNITDGLIDDKEKLAVYGTAILREAHQLSELVEQILEFSAIQKHSDRYHLEPVNIEEVVEFSLKNTAALIQSADVKVEQTLQGGLPRVIGDFKALSRCLQNLIANAVKYGGEARWMGIRTSLQSSAGTSEVRVSVADKGIGIRPEECNHIFEPFYRTPEASTAQIHGTGLGLPLAKRIAEAMDGRITVESEPGKGSTFTLHLPVK
jgi:two-component system, OmpR family, sensor histidine kinase SenX3